MPYPNEHSARITNPDQYDRLRRKNDVFGQGIHAIYGVKSGKSEVQAIRFDKDRYTPAEARAWLKKHDYDPIEFEPASGESESAREIGTVFVPLYEATPRADGTIPAKIIQPGWGSSGYYSEDLLKAAARFYRSGLHMFWNHQTDDQAKAMPERDLRDLAAVLVEDARYDAGGPRGPGLYSRFKPFSHFAGAIEELGPHIGLSHVAYGKAEKGEAEGRKGPIIKEILGVRSVDFVTVPGAGGAVLEAFREAWQAQQSNITQPGSEPVAETPISIEEVRKRPDIVEALRKEFLDDASLKEAQAQQKKELDEANAEVTRLEEELAEARGKLAVADARTIIAEGLKEADLPEPAKKKIAETLAQAPPIKDGKLDETALKQKVVDAVKVETDYLKAIGEATKTGAGGGGHIRGMGSGGTPAPGSGLKESFKRAYLQEGKSEEEAERLATIAARGR